MKTFFKGRFFWLVLVFVLFSQVAYARIYCDLPIVDGMEDQTGVEQGATYRVSVMYENETGAAVDVYAISVYLKYDTAYLDEITSSQLTNDQSTLMNNGGFDDPADDPGEIHFSVIPNNNDIPLNVDDGEEISLITITFHVKPGAVAGSDLSLVEWWDELGPGETLLDYIHVYGEGEADYSGTITDPIDPVDVVTAAEPSFDGIDTTYDGDEINSNPSVGNTITLNWVATGGNASDYNADAYGAAQTYYSDSKLRYHVYRNAVSLSDFTLGNMGTDYYYRDGNASGIASTGLNDGTSYSYAVYAVDNTDTGTNPDDTDYTATGPQIHATAVVSETPTDTTAPSDVTGFTITPGNAELELNWSNPSDADIGGIVIIRRDDGSPVGAHGLDGADIATYAHGEIVVEGLSLGGGTVIFTGIVEADTDTTGQRDEGEDTNLVPSTYTDTSVVNGTTYNYLIIVYDQTNGSVGDGLVQMGRNYSDGTAQSGTPGVDPDPVTNFMALSNVENGITFSWTISDPTVYAGTRIVYTNNFDEWLTLDENTAEAIGDYDYDPLVVNEVQTQEGLSPDLTYYFAALVYNNTKSNWSTPVYAAAVPGGLDVDPETHTFTFYSGYPSGTGINGFSMPFASPWYAYYANGDAMDFIPGGDSPDEISTALHLVLAINEASGAGSNIVSTFGYWDASAQDYTGVMIGDTIDIQDVADLNFALAAGVGYQVYVEQDGVEFIIKDVVE